MRSGAQGLVAGAADRCPRWQQKWARPGPGRLSVDGNADEYWTLLYADGADWTDGADFGGGCKGET
jgi:hypothetical protein